MGAAYPAEVFDWHHFLYGFERDGEELAVAGVEQERFFSGEQIRIEGETARDYVQRSADAIDAGGDFVDARGGFLVGNHLFSSLCDPKFVSR
jgi:hypothetical protein